jgi:hypothetical protein
MMTFVGETLAAGRMALVAGLAVISVVVSVFYHSSAWGCATNMLMGDPAERVFELRIEGGKVAEDMRAIRVMVKDTVHLHWTTDAPSVLHLHGYDIEKEVQPGAVTEFTFEAHTTGRFPVDAHDKGQSRGAQHERAPIAHLEVYPR